MSLLSRFDLGAQLRQGHHALVESLHLLCVIKALAWCEPPIPEYIAYQFTHVPG